ncbi:hypothetical protein [Aeromonas hydrophila]|uniref:hypothetical protein n=1 Tax=Aeromonas hydrophila TaxID=644 RepID=UPI002B49EE9E|nr:hypothetical protein [Aeromonas hydrophila]
MSIIKENFFRALNRSLGHKAEQDEASRRLKEEFKTATSSLLKRIQNVFAGSRANAVIDSYAFNVGEESFDTCNLQITCDNRSITIEPQNFTDESSALVTGVLKVTVSNPDSKILYDFLLHWKDKNDPSSEWMILANAERTCFTIDEFIKNVYPFSE